jgi:hypothetical protein
MICVLKACKLPSFKRWLTASFLSRFLPGTIGKVYMKLPSTVCTKRNGSTFERMLLDSKTVF